MYHKIAQERREAASSRKTLYQKIAQERREAASSRKTLCRKNFISQKFCITYKNFWGLRLGIILAGVHCPPDPPVFGWGGFAPLDPPLKRSFVTFDRGGQTGPPRSNDFFFGAADDTRVAWTSGRTSGRTPDVLTRRRVQRTNLKPKIKNPNPP